MPAQLVSLADGPSILLDKPILLIGRHPECDIQIDSRKISRRHCCIAQVGDYLVVRDLASTNGIRINGVRVLEGRLKADDELTIGGYRYQVSWDELSPRSAETPQGTPEPAEPDGPLDVVPIDNDERVEACDQPIPLAEAAAAPPGVVGRDSDAPVASGLQPNQNDPKASPFSERARSRIIPENLDLAPASDYDVRTPRPS
jgi:pSer/pThr/pTyr-binding forkhead associated (FHA) protein